MNRPKRERRWQSPRDRARVAAELLEEAESLTETCLIATPADLAQATKPRPIQMPAVLVPPPPSPPASEPTPPPVVAVPMATAEVRVEEMNEATLLVKNAVTLLRRGLWSDAALELQRAIAVDASRSDAWCHLGEALNHIDDLSGALAAYTRATELQPANAKAFHGQGIVLDRLNRPEDATRMYRRAREVSRR
jgi:tetratricopeptide (TPR) repeat protein